MAFDQLTLSMIVVMGTSALFAAEVDAVLMLYLVNLTVSIPASFKTSFSHLDMVSVVIPLCGVFGN